MRRAVAITAGSTAFFLFIATIASAWLTIWQDDNPWGADIGVENGRLIYDGNLLNLSGLRMSRGWHYDTTRPIKLRLLPTYEGDRFGAYLAIPLWPFAFGFAATAVATHRRISPNSCRRCRYDLRGLPPTAPCPECGSPRPS